MGRSKPKRRSEAEKCDDVICFFLMPRLSPSISQYNTSQVKQKAKTPLERMGCQQSKVQKSTKAEMMSSDTSSSIPSVAVSSRPPAECQGYPPPLLPDFGAASNFADVDFYIGEEERREQSTADSEERQPRLACTLTWCKGGLAGGTGSAAAGDGAAPAPTIDDVRRTNANNNTSSQRRPVIIVCHGFLSWRNQMLISHVAAGLAQKLNCHALRFDFRGNGHSGGRWCSAGFGEELCDLRTVVDYVRNELGCKVICIAGHSKGSAAVLRYALEQQESKNHDDGQNTFVPCFVNLSGRFVTPGEFDIKTRFSKEQCDELAKEGKFTMKTFGGKEVVVTQEDIDERSNASSAFVSEIRTSSVLTIHGSADTTVDIKNARKYECIPRHLLKIIEGGDHNFNGLKFVGEIVASIGEFIKKSSAVVDLHV